MRSAETQHTDWSLASRPHRWHANNNRQRRVCFDGECFLPSPFLPLFLATSQFFLELSSWGPITRSAEAQATDWSLASRPHRRHANDNRQQRVHFRGAFLFPFNFLPIYFSLHLIFFKSSAMVLPRERPKLSPQTEFCLPPNTIALPTTRGSSGYIFAVRSCFLPIFYQFISCYI
jgi:hypothetical protein